MRTTPDRVLLVRPDDQLRVELVFEDLVLDGDHLMAAGDTPGVLTLVVPAQHTVEAIPDAEVPAEAAANRARSPPTTGAR